MHVSFLNVLLFFGVIGCLGELISYDAQWGQSLGVCLCLCVFVRVYVCAVCALLGYKRR